MALLTLKDIGKIYVSEGNVAVGIRGVNLSFDRGEFVAVTGKSGSGKSTLLNVLSGMDSYEEGEMFVEDEPTSHFIQEDWEEYRQKYISFIFQDYNIIESFTVLQNVELALMHIENPKERRERALELLERVGLSGHIHHKGSKLSGGQKQRTVIARALAKDSPIILADEPTGNLDSKTSKEIIDLLREVSKDKLVVVVTHNFDQVEHCATRHVRIFDGAVEADQKMAEVAPISEPVKYADSGVEKKGWFAQTKELLQKGWVLGRTRFLATPKLSIFLCFLMTAAALILTLITSLSYDARELFYKDYVFTHMDGRVVVTKRDGSVISAEELDRIAKSSGAKDTVAFDYLLDYVVDYSAIIDGLGINTYTGSFEEFRITYDEFDGIDVGRAPEKPGEIMLRVPIWYQPMMGKNNLLITQWKSLFGYTNYTITGVDYFYDNTKAPQIVFTREGYEIASALAIYFNQSSTMSFSITASDQAGEEIAHITDMGGRDLNVSFEIPENSYYVVDENLKTLLSKSPNYTMDGCIEGFFMNRYYSENAYGHNTWDYYYSEESIVTPEYGERETLKYEIPKMKEVSDLPSDVNPIEMTQLGTTIVIPASTIQKFIEDEYCKKAYLQASLFYKNDRQATKAAKDLNEGDYIAVASNEYRTGNSAEKIISTIVMAIRIFMWFVGVSFAAMFLSLCSSRAMLATKGDVAILRSMGIPAKVVKTSIYIQTMLALIPAYIVTAIVCIIIFTTPKTNENFVFLPAFVYMILFVAMLLMAVLLSKRYVKKMFDESVKKTMRGGAEA